MQKKRPATTAPYQAALKNVVSEALGEPLLVFFAGKLFSERAITCAKHSYRYVQRDEVNYKQLNGGQEVTETTRSRSLKG
jgi:hypothetical protein